MDDSKKLIFWFISNQKKIDLAITTYSWGLGFAKKIYDFSVKIKINFITFEGRGTSYSEENALVKALAECLERSLISYNSLETSNGIAVHTSYDLACINAKNEALERDSFFCHFLTETSFKKMNISEELIQKNGCAEAICKLNENKISVNFYEMSTSMNMKAILCICHGSTAARPFGMTVGMSCGHDLFESIEKSFLESIRCAFHFLNQNEDNISLSIENFKLKNNHSELDHIHLCYDIDYAEKISKIYFSNEKCKTLNILTESVGQIINLKIPDIFQGLQIYGVKYFDKNLQDLYFGITVPQKINTQRIKYFSPKFNIYNMTQIPHFLG